MSEPFDAERAMLSGPNFFQRLRVPRANETLADAGVPGDEDLLIAERNGDELVPRSLDGVPPPCGG